MAVAKRERDPEVHGVRSVSFTCMHGLRMAGVFARDVLRNYRLVQATSIVLTNTLNWAAAALPARTKRGK